jgi:hypothetical protein
MEYKCGSKEVSIQKKFKCGSKEVLVLILIKNGSKEVTQEIKYQFYLIYLKY